MQIHGWVKITRRENNKRFGTISDVALPCFSAPLVGESNHIGRVSFVDSLVGGDAVLYNRSYSVVLMIGEGKSLGKV